MKIIDKDGIEIFDPDLSLGKLVPDKLFIAHHEAIEAVEEVWHYEYGIHDEGGEFVSGETYPSGGQDAVRIIDTHAVEGQEAWDEYEDVYRYLLYTPEELAEIARREEERQNNAPVTWAQLMEAYQKGVFSA